MVRPEVVARKLAHLSPYLEELKPYRAVSLEEYVAEGGPRRTIERLLQLLVEVAADINVHIVTEIEGTPPTDYRSSFSAMVRCGVLSHDLAERLAPSAGLRNILVHAYDEIDDEEVHGSIAPALEDFEAYRDAVRGWLDEHYPDD